MERAGGNKKDMIRTNCPIFSADNCSFNKRQQIALHTLTTDIRALPITTCTDFVDLIEKNNPVIFDQRNGFANDAFLVKQLIAFLFDQKFIAFLY